MDGYLFRRLWEASYPFTLSSRTITLSGGSGTIPFTLDAVVALTGFVPCAAPGYKSVPKKKKKKRLKDIVAVFDNIVRIAEGLRAPPVSVSSPYVN